MTSLLPDGNGVAYATAEPVLGFVDAANRARIAQAPRHIDFHDRARHLDPPVALRRRHRNHHGARPRRWPSTSARVRSTALGPATGRDFGPPAASGYGMAVTDWRDSRTPKVNGERMALEPAETARSAAVSPAGAVVGTDFFVRFVGRNGTGWKVPASSPAWAVHASADGRLVVACFGDGTIRWFSTADGRELIALFIDPATGRFVVWTPAGYFDHDHRDDGKPDGRKLIGYRINEPSGRTSDFVSIGQLYPTWFRPDLVGLSFRDDSNARRVVERAGGPGRQGRRCAARRSAAESDAAGRVRRRLDDRDRLRRGARDRPGERTRGRAADGHRARAAGSLQGGRSGRRVRPCGAETERGGVQQRH